MKKFKLLICTVHVWCMVYIYIMALISKTMIKIITCGLIDTVTLTDNDMWWHNSIETGEHNAIKNYVTYCLSQYMTDA